MDPFWFGHRWEAPRNGIAGRWAPQTNNLPNSVSLAQDQAPMLKIGTSVKFQGLLSTAQRLCEFPGHLLHFACTKPPVDDCMRTPWNQHCRDKRGNDGANIKQIIWTYKLYIYTHIYIYTIYIYIYIIEGSLEVKLPTIWTDEMQSREEAERRKIRRKKSRRGRVWARRKKMQMREKVGKSRNTVFFQWFVAPEGRKVGSLKRRVRS